MAKLHLGRRTWLTALLTVLVLGGVAAGTTAALARTELPIYGEDVVYTDNFDNGGWEVVTDGAGTGCPDCLGFMAGNPEASLGVGITGWAAVRKTITISNHTSNGVKYDYCYMSVLVGPQVVRGNTHVLVNLEVINPSTYNYMNVTRKTFNSMSGEVRTTGGNFTPSPRTFVVGVALVADPKNVNVYSLNETLSVDSLIVKCHYFYYP